MYRLIASNRLKNFLRIREIFKKKIRFLLLKRLVCERAGSYGDCLGPKRSSAIDVARCVADHIDICLRETSFRNFFGPCLRNWSKLVTIMMIVSKSADGKIMVNTVRCELQLRAPLNISGQEADDPVGRRNAIKQNSDSRQNDTR